MGRSDDVAGMLLRFFHASVSSDRTFFNFGLSEAVSRERAMSYAKESQKVFQGVLPERKVGNWGASYCCCPNPTMGGDFWVLCTEKVY